MSLLLSPHLQTIAVLDRRHPDLADAVRAALNLQPGLALAPALREEGMGQADLVLCLLHANHPHSRAFVERLIGHRITVLPGFHLCWPVNGVPHLHAPRILRVVPNPRKRGTAAAQRFVEIFRPGRTVEQCRARGATVRDLRMARKRGWIVLEDAR